MRRDRDRECRTRAQLARYPNLAAVEFDELPTERQPEPRPLRLLLRRPHLPELLEHRILVLWRNAPPGIADCPLHGPILWHCRDLDPAALRRELDRIRQEVQEDLPDLPF